MILDDRGFANLIASAQTLRKGRRYPEAIALIDEHLDRIDEEGKRSALLECFYSAQEAGLDGKADECAQKLMSIDPNIPSIKAFLMGSTLPQHSAENSFQSHISLTLTYNEVHHLVETNNQSTTFSTELITCMIWKESTFNPNAVNGSHRGLMQISPGAVAYVNANTPHGVHFNHSEMFDPSRNIMCGTWYLRKTQEHNSWNVKTTLEHYGTGAGYADSILTCESCIKSHPSSPQPCLDAIH